MLQQCSDTATNINCGGLPSHVLVLQESEVKHLSAPQHTLQDRKANYSSQAMHPDSFRSAIVGSEPAQASPLNLETPEYLAHGLLVEFGKTRTNYNSLVPRIVEVMKIFRDFGPMRCPLPVVSNLDELLNDEALIRIEHRYPNSMEAGFLVLCTERRALRSGGGGKYYFMDTSGRLVGCHKSDLPNYAEKGVLRGPVLLKNLIFVFIMRGAFGLDPRCKSSNPQRLLEFYENLVKEGKVSDIQRLVRVWSMEIYPEAPYDNGFPHCTLLWVKRMHVTAHISKWKHSQWQTNQLRVQDVYSHPRQSHSLTVNHLSYLQSSETPQLEAYQESVPADNLLNNGLSNQHKRRRLCEPYNSNVSSYDTWHNPQQQLTCISQDTTQQHPIDVYGNHDREKENYGFSAHQIGWDLASVEALYTGFAEFSAGLQKGDVMDWSMQLIDRLSTPVLGAAMHLISNNFNVTKVEEDCANDKALRYDILRIICETKERERMVEALRILLACLVQQQRLEEYIPSSSSSSRKLQQEELDHGVSGNQSNQLHTISDINSHSSGKPLIREKQNTSNYFQHTSMIRQHNSEPGTVSTFAETTSDSEESHQLSSCLEANNCNNAKSEYVYDKNALLPESLNLYTHNGSDPGNNMSCNLDGDNQSIRKSSILEYIQESKLDCYSNKFYHVQESQNQLILDNDNNSYHLVLPSTIDHSKTSLNFVSHQPSKSVMQRPTETLQLTQKIENKDLSLGESWKDNSKMCQSQENSGDPLFSSHQNFNNIEINHSSHIVDVEDWQDGSPRSIEVHSNVSPKTYHSNEFSGNMSVLLNALSIPTFVSLK